MKIAAIAAGTLLVIAGIAGPAAAQGAGQVYANGGYTNYDFSGQNFGAVTGRLGYQITPNIGVEGEASTGVSENDNAKLHDAFGAYAVGTVPVTSNLNVFGRVGWQKAEVDGKNGFAGYDEDGVGYGVGANLHVNGGFGVRGEYTRLDGDRDANTWSLAGTLAF